MRYLRESVTPGRVDRGWTLASLSLGTQHKIAGRGSDLSAHEPVTLDVDAVSFTDVTTGRSDHTYFSRADTTNSCSRRFSRVGAANVGWISGRSGQD